MSRKEFFSATCYIKEEGNGLIISTCGKEKNTNIITLLFSVNFNVTHSIWKFMFPIVEM